MKLVTCFALALLLCFSATWANQTSNRGDISQDDLEQMKNNAVSGDPDYQGLVGGEDIANAVPIPALPYSDGGDTCGFLNDYDEACPFTGSTSPDVVYSYSGGLDIDIDLCNSLYDTKVYVYENAAGNLVACNDDACGSDGFRSQLLCVPTTNPGSTYYIVVDGYGGACGTYDLSVTECTPCIVDCPPGSALEGEVDCFDDYKDSYNSGCNNNGAPVFTEIPCSPTGVTMCGTYGGYFHSPSGFNYRDTDWYSLPAGANLDGFTFSVTGELETLTGYLAADCTAPAFEEFAVIGPCDVISFSPPVGDWWVFVATSGFGGLDFPCGSAYTITFDGLDCDPISIEPSTWGEIKGNYK